MKWIFGQQVNKRRENSLETISTNNDIRSFRFLQGCVMFEVIALRPLFPGTNELDQINKIHDVIGTPSVATLEKFHQ